MLLCFSKPVCPNTLGKYGINKSEREIYVVFVGFKLNWYLINALLVACICDILQKWNWSYIPLFSGMSKQNKH